VNRTTDTSTTSSVEPTPSEIEFPVLVQLNKSTKNCPRQIEEEEMSVIMAYDPMEIHEMAHVVLTLVCQATNKLELDTKFDAQEPHNQKSLICELTKRAMDYCSEAHRIFSFTFMGTTQMNLLLPDYEEIPIKIIQQDAVTEKAGTLDALQCCMHSACPSSF
jgi:hypothetical protein